MKKEFETEVLDITIEDLDEKGRGVGRYRHPTPDNSLGKQLTVFVDHTVVGDRVRVTVPNAKGRRKAAIRQYDELLEAGPSRDMTFKADPQTALGVPLMAMSYSHQLNYKETLVHQYLEAVGITKDVIEPIIGMDQPYRYRNKMEFSFGPNQELGMYQTGDYRTIIDLKDSYLAPELMIAIKNMVSQWQKDYQLPGYNKLEHKGLLRSLIVRQSFACDELMVVVFATQESETIKLAVNDLIQRLTTNFPAIASVLWVKHHTINENTYDQVPEVLFGRDYINDSLYGFNYRIYRDTFFQVNPQQATKIVDCALAMAQIQPDMRVLDLFCGVGTFSLPLAKQAKALAGIELVASSIASAKRNALDNNIDNTFFMASDVRHGLKELLDVWGSPDLILLDPPRSGAGGKVMRAIGRLQTQRIVYVSCNPKTLATDLLWLKEYGYTVKKVQPIDQFPHTTHVECVVLMSRVDK